MAYENISFGLHHNKTHWKNFFGYFNFMEDELSPKDLGFYDNKGLSGACRGLVSANGG